MTGTEQTPTSPPHGRTVRGGVHVLNVLGQAMHAASSAKFVPTKARRTATNQQLRLSEACGNCVALVHTESLGENHRDDRVSHGASGGLWR
jgi:hypothetical protein